MKDYKVILGCLHMEVINVLYDKGINRIKDKTTLSLGAITIKWANTIILQKDYGLFLIIMTFAYKRIFKWNLLYLVIKNIYNFSNASHFLC